MMRRHDVAQIGRVRPGEGAVDPTGAEKYQYHLSGFS